jgi:hypothetical protein
MRFKKQDRHEYEVTRRKRLAVSRWQQRQRDSLPLLAAEIGAKQPGVDEVMSERIDRWATIQQANRDHQAAQWRQGRRELQQMEPKQRRAILVYWNGHKWLPGTPTYFLNMLHSIRTGRLIRQGETFRFATGNTSAAEAMQIDPTNKPRIIPGLTRPGRQGGPML